tara:strand:+ start:47345 stop:47518 length:174 start_codon:yes stop_codon:yes gene_type:complete
MGQRRAPRKAPKTRRTATGSGSTRGQSGFSRYRTLSTGRIRKVPRAKGSKKGAGAKR